MFIGFMIFQTLIVLFGIYIANAGTAAGLGADAEKKLAAMRQVFQSISAIGVVACVMIARVKLNPEAVKSAQDMFKATLTCLMIGEITVLLAAVGLARLFLGQFLLSASLIYAVDFLIVLPAGLRLLSQPAEKIEDIRNKFEL